MQRAMLVAAILAIGGLISCEAIAAERVAGSAVGFERTRLDDKFRSEGVAAGDFNHDGRLDVAAGSVIYLAPDWRMVSVTEAPQEFDPHNYSNSFCNFAEDLNGDGWDDLIVVDFPGKETWWFQNPREAGGPWPRHVVAPVTNNESPDLRDIDSDGRRELIFGAADRMAFARPEKDPLSPWQIHTVSGANAPGTNRFSHGIGAGDVNGDGRQDLVITEGWWEAPADPAAAEWAFHAAPFGQACAHMYVYDCDGDGDGDVVSSSAHNIGVWWYEQKPDGWQQHEISTAISQTHSLCLVDMNDDGLADLVTGKRWWAHGPSGDVQSDQPAVVVWFELTRADGRPTWTPHTFDRDSGVGTQFQVVDMNGDGLLDVITANKKGAHYFAQTRK